MSFCFSGRLRVGPARGLLTPALFPAFFRRLFFCRGVFAPFFHLPVFPLSLCAPQRFLLFFFFFRPFFSGAETPGSNSLLFGPPPPLPIFCGQQVLSLSPPPADNLSRWFFLISFLLVDILLRPVYRRLFFNTPPTILFVRVRVRP